MKIHSVEAAAAMLGVSVQTMWRMRRDGRGPPFVRVGRKVAYPDGGLNDYAAAGGSR